MRVAKTCSGIEIQLYINDKEMIERGEEISSKFNSGPKLLFKVLKDVKKGKTRTNGQRGFDIQAFPMSEPHEKREYYSVVLSEEKWELLTNPPYGLEANHFGTRTIFDRIDILYWNMRSNFPKDKF